jgi:CRP-like cAMP-binding protein
MTDTEMESYADRLLRHNHAGHATGYYTEKQLARHRWREWTGEDIRLSQMQITETELQEFAADDLKRLARDAGLGDRETTCLLLSIPPAPASHQDIADTLGFSLSTVQRDLNHARSVLLHVLPLWPWWGWLIVYWQEVHR